MKSSSISLGLSVEDFIENMIKEGITRAYLLHYNGKVVLSHHPLESLAKEILKLDDYLNHEALFLEVDEKLKTLYTAAVYASARGAGAGGTRLRNDYNTAEGLITDVLRLAKGMSDKNACANLWWGGGKSIIYTSKNPRELKAIEREAIFTNFGRFIASLNGYYHCAEDMNVKPEDLQIVHSVNRFTTCIPPAIGGSGNPSPYTAQGVFNGMQAGVRFLSEEGKFATSGLAGKHVLLQGAGNVGYALLEMLVDAGAKVTVIDRSEATKQRILKEFKGKPVEIHDDADSFYDIEADILSPNAIGAILNDETIPRLKVKLVAGGANNQLKDVDKHAAALQNHGILYLPDFYINRMGIVNCANEQYGYLRSDISREANLVFRYVYMLLHSALEQGITPQEAAMQEAELKAKQPHPIHGHRGLEILKQLIQDKWGMDS